MLKGGLLGCRKRLITLHKSLLPQVSRKIPEKAKRQELLRSAGAWDKVSLPPGAHPSASAEVGLLGYVNPSSAVAASPESSGMRHGRYRIDSLSELCMTFLHGEVKNKTYFEYEVGSGAFGSLSAAVAKALAKIKTHESGTKKQVKADEGYDQPKNCVNEKVLIKAVTNGPNTLPSFTSYEVKVTNGNIEVYYELKCIALQVKKEEYAVAALPKPELAEYAKLGLPIRGAERVVFTLELKSYEKAYFEHKVGSGAFGSLSAAAGKAKLGQRKANVKKFQINGGIVEQKVNFTMNFFEQEAKVSNIFAQHKTINVIGATKAKGLTGVGAHWGYTSLSRLAHRGLRIVACIGAWRPARVQFHLPRSGPNGFHLQRRSVGVK
jgi:hypothetical protein